MGVAISVLQLVVGTDGELFITKRKFGNTVITFTHLFQLVRNAQDRVRDSSAEPFEMDEFGDHWSGS